MTTKNKNWILHVDGDAFFASVEQSRRPDLWQKPVVVGEERGIATALSYEAKKLGIQRGEPIFKIKKNFPQVVILSSHFELYNQYSKSLFNLLEKEVENLERYSIDECFAVLSCQENELYTRVKKIKELVQKKLGITYSFGASTTKVLAKVASKLNKPNGLCILIEKDKIDKVLQNTKLEKVWGLGRATCQKLNSYGYYTANDFIKKNLPPPLSKTLTKNILEIREELLGIKKLQVGSSTDHKKSIQATRTFLIKTNNKEVIYSELSKNLETALFDLQQNNLYTNRLECFVKPYISYKPNEQPLMNQKIISEKFDFSFHTQNFISLSSVLNKFLERLFEKNPISCGKNAMLYKSSGIVLSNLIKKQELPVSLFGSTNKDNQDNSNLNFINEIREKYGFGVINLASSKKAIQTRTDDQNKREASDNYEYGLPYKYLGIIS